MDPTDSGQGQENPPEQQWDLTPSSKGRQRKKNSRYCDYETGAKITVQKTPSKSPRGRKAAAAKTPARTPKGKNAAQEATNGAKEVTVKTAQEPDGKTPEETPKKVRKPRKTPAKSPARKTPVADGDVPEAEGGVGGADAVKQENGTPKPKRKYVRKQQNATPVAETPPPSDGPAEPEEEVEPGGRRRRGAAKAALKYLQILAKEVLGHPSDEADPHPGANREVEAVPVPEQKTPKGTKRRRGQKRKRRDSDDEDDEDFVPDANEEQVEEMGDEEDDAAEEEEEDFDLDLDFRTSGRSPAASHRGYAGSNAKTPNGLTVNVMKTVWDAIETTKKFREEHYSSWVFPEWVPSTSDWHLVPERDLEKFLPQEFRSAAFRVSREGVAKEDAPLRRLGRFEALPAHPERWDMLLFAGGPVWATEWCPTPDGAPATQYVALACHRGMDDLHYVHQTYAGAGLVQLWDVGSLEYNSSPDSRPALAYGLAQDRGFVWQMKWCPAGGWELPSCVRKVPFLPRLGLLAVATSDSVVTIYSLPHPDALRSNKKQPESGNQLPIFQAAGVLTLTLGSFKAPRGEQSGQVLCLDWLPEKPHNIMAVGFYDGMVGLWDLSTKSALLRVRQPDKSLSLLPYRCLLAHDHAVRALAFCRASRHLLVTAGEDRQVKTWDLRRLYEPVTAQKRYLTNEIYWPLNAPGLLLAQEAAYVAKGSHGVHYFNHNQQTIFAVPRTGTLWSISYTDWLNSVVTSDSLGEVVLALLPQITFNPPYLKHTIERRFPVYYTSVVPYDPAEEEHQEVGGGGGGGGEEEEEEEEVEEEEGGEGEGDARSEGRDESADENGREGGRRNKKRPRLRFHTYREAVKKYTLQHTDSDMRTFVGSEKRAPWKRMKNTEGQTKMNLDDMPLASLHKVRFNPNMSCHTWVVSAGQAGLVRLHCMRSMISPHVKEMIGEHQAQFNALYSPPGPPEPPEPPGGASPSPPDFQPL